MDSLPPAPGVGGAPAPPSLVLKSHTKSQTNGNAKAIVRKCSCRRTWCPTCSLNSGVKRFYDRIKEWDYRYTRQLVLSVDRTLFDSPAQALREITKKKYISNLMRDLKRTRGIDIVDWAWVLEWHKDGFPHWHLFVNVAKKGRSGMIGHDAIDYYWKAGFVWEGPINNQKHWQSLTGYFAKTGYFEKKKAHQGRLPAWARERYETIRRTGSKAQPDPQNQNLTREKIIFKEERKLKDGENNAHDKLEAIRLGLWFKDQAEAEPKQKRTQGEMLDECGESVDIAVHGKLHGNIGIVRIPYREIRRYPGDYIAGVGYVIDFDQAFLKRLEPKLDWEQKMTLIENTNERILYEC